MLRFNLRQDDVNGVLGTIHILQTIFCLSVGLLLVFAPTSRYGYSFKSLFAINPQGDDLLGIALLFAGLVMAYALIRKRKKLMGIAVLFAGLLFWVLATFLILGSLLETTGVLGLPFCLYVGAHMIIQSVPLTRGQ